jgi:mannose-1-phosphate guanylyltransferase
LEDEGIEKEIKKVAAFKEKPVLEKAQEYVNSGNYLWNAGIFIWKAANLQKAFEKYAVEIDTLFKSGNAFYNTPAEAQFILDQYPGSPDISIDYAILEKADNIYTIPADIGWSDLGTWASLHAIARQDEHHNVCNSEHLHLHETHDCMINLPKGKAAVIRGLDNFIVVDDEQVLLIYPKSAEQEIKGVSKEMVSRFGDQYS